MNNTIIPNADGRDFTVLPEAPASAPDNARPERKPVGQTTVWMSLIRADDGTMTAGYYDEANPSQTFFFPGAIQVEVRMNGDLDLAAALAAHLRDFEAPAAPRGIVSEPELLVDSATLPPEAIRRMSHPSQASPEAWARYMMDSTDRWLENNPERADWIAGYKKACRDLLRALTLMTEAGPPRADVEGPRKMVLEPAMAEAIRQSLDRTASPRRRED